MMSKEYVAEANIKENKDKKTLLRAIQNNHDNSLLIHNLSKFDLKQSHIDVVSKGLGFVPTLKPTLLSDIYLPLYKCCRPLYLRCHFLNETLPDLNKTFQITHFTLPLHWSLLLCMAIA